MWPATGLSIPPESSSSPLPAVPTGMPSAHFMNLLNTSVLPFSRTSIFITKSGSCTSTERPLCLSSNLPPICALISGDFK